MNKIIKRLFVALLITGSMHLFADNQVNVSNPLVKRLPKKNIAVHRLALYNMLVEVKSNINRLLQGLLVQGDADQNTENNLLGAVGLVDEEIKLMEQIVNELNNQCFFTNPEIEYRFVNMCNFLADVDSIEPRHIRWLCRKVEQFNEYVTIYCMNRKDFLDARDLDLFNNITKFNQILAMCLLREEYFEIGFFDSLSDYVIHQPWEFICDNPLLTGVVVTALITIAGYYGYQHYKKVSKNTEQSKLDLDNPPTNAGLKNGFNNCYQNAVLQAIFNSPPVVNHLKKNKDTYKGEVIPEKLIELLEKVEQEKHPVNPKDFSRTAQKEYFKESKLDQQQDAGEFTQKLLSDLKLPPEILDVVSISKVCCSGCKRESSQTVAMTSLLLPIPKKNNPTLSDCLDEFCEKDTTSFSGDNQYQCAPDGCNSKQDATKQFSFSKEPQALVIGLNRFESQFVKKDDGSIAGKSKKIGTNVSFPKNNLSLKDYLVNNDAQATYNLTGVVYHIGASTGSGHYVSSVKDKNNQEWYTYNDTSITECRDIDDVCRTGKSYNGTPYYLFYEKAKTNNKPKE